jgi:hypothetical protein
MPRPYTLLPRWPSALRWRRALSRRKLAIRQFDAAAPPVSVVGAGFKTAPTASCPALDLPACGCRSKISSINLLERPDEPDGCAPASGNLAERTQVSAAQPTPFSPDAPDAIRLPLRDLAERTRGAPLRPPQSGRTNPRGAQSTARHTDKSPDARRIANCRRRPLTAALPGSAIRLPACRVACDRLSRRPRSGSRCGPRWHGSGRRVSPGADAGARYPPRWSP